MVKFSELPADANITGTELLANADAGTSKSITVDGVKNYTEANLDLANIPGTLTVPQGGTGANTLDGIVTGTGTSALTAKKSEFNQAVDPAVTDDSNAGYIEGSRWINTTANKEYVCVDASVGAAVWIETTAGASGGEANTASNQGAGGVGFFDNKNGVDLEFRNLNVGSNKLTVALDAPNKEVDIDVAEANLDLGNMSGQVGTTQIADNAVTLAKVQNAVANDKLLGSGNAGSGNDYAELTIGTNLTMSGTTLNADTQAGTTNLGYTPSAIDGTVTSDTGTNATLPLATPTGGSNQAGLLSPGDKDKLDNTSGTNTGDQTITLTGDVTGSGTGSFATTIANNVVTNAKLATVGTGIFKGRVTAGVGNVENLTGTQATTLLDDFVGDSGAGGTKGLVPAPASGDAADLRYLNADGTWKAPLPDFSVGNSDTALAQLVPTGDPTLVATIGYNILDTLLEANESQDANKTIVYRDTSDVIQGTYLDETNNKFLFPSNLNTFDFTYVSYFIRTVLVIDLSATNNTTTKYYVRLRRVVDDTIIAVDEFIQSDFVAQTGAVITSEIKTFVSGETDPFVVDGCYIDILNDSNSGGTVTLQDVSVRIFRD